MKRLIEGLILSILVTMLWRLLNLEPLAYYVNDLVNYGVGLAK